ncbi:MAG: multicopper oxidase domain-containing protein [Caldilineaceae bacterium]
MFHQSVRQFLARRDFLRLGLGSTLGAAGVLLQPTAAPAPAAAPAAAPAGAMPGMSMPDDTAPTPGHAHGQSMLVGAVDHAANGFDPMRVLVDWDYGEVSTLPSGQRLREYEIFAGDKEIEIAPGIRFPAWTYNARVPGPTIRCTEGDRVRIHFYNGSSHPHTLHFHGIHPAEMDGVPGAGPGEIQPGQEFVYEFDAYPFGCHLYHCHAAPLKRHIHKGLYGAFIVDPAEGRPPAREFMMMMNAFDTNFDNKNEIYAVNTVGHEFARRPIPIKVGERVRLYLINIIEFDLINSLHLHAEFFDYYDHGTTLEPTHRTVDTIIQCQAQRGLVEFSYRWPGQYMFHAHQSEFAELGWMGFFRAMSDAEWANGLAAAAVDAEWDQRGLGGSTVDPVTKEVVR